MTNGTSKIVEHIDAFVSGLTTFKMADIRTRGNRAFFLLVFQLRIICDPTRQLTEQCKRGLIVSVL